MTPDGHPPDELAQLEHQAQGLVDRHRYAQARRVIAEGLRQFPDSDGLEYLAAVVAFLEDDNAVAMATVGRLLARTPQHYGGRVLAARLHQEANAFSEAEALWLELLREYPEDPDLYANYADLMLRTMHIDKAGRLVREGLRLEPDHEACLFVATLVDVIEGRDPGHRGIHLEQLVTRHPDRLRTSLALVSALHDQGRNREAFRIAQELVRAQPDSAPLVELARDLKVQSHWSMLPLYPMQRWGWTGAAAVTVGGIVGLRALGGVLPGPVSGTLGLLWLAYVVYSWTWPAVLKKLL